MRGFEDVTLTWQGRDYTVPANRVFELVRRVETTIMDGKKTAAFVLLLNNAVPQSVLAMSYAEALRFAGAEVTAEEVYLTIMHGFANDAAQAAIDVQQAVIGLLCIISPPMAHEILKPSGGEKK